MIHKFLMSYTTVFTTVTTMSLIISYANASNVIKSDLDREQESGQSHHLSLIDSESIESRNNQNLISAQFCKEKIDIIEEKKSEPKEKPNLFSVTNNNSLDQNKVKEAPARRNSNPGSPMINKFKPTLSKIIEVDETTQAHQPVGK